MLGVIFVLSFTASAFATDIQLGGDIKVRGWYMKNVEIGGIDGFYVWDGTGYDSEGSLIRVMPWNKKEGFSYMYDGGPLDGVTSSHGDDATSSAWYEQRLTLTMDAKVADNLKGFVELETTSDNYGHFSTGTRTWGNNSFNNSIGTLDVNQAWILYTGSGLGVPAGIKIGHQPLALSHKMFWDHTRHGDDSIVVFADPTKEMHVALLTVKAVEGNIGDNTDDIDGYCGLITYKIDANNTLGANYAYLNGGTGSQLSRLSLQNLGVHAGGNVTGLSYKAEVDLQFGKVEKGTPDEAKFKGYGIFANLGYKIDPINVRASFALGSGDADMDDNKIKEFQTLLGPDDIHYSFIYEYIISSAAFNQAIPNGVSDNRSTGIANTTYYNLGVDYSVTKDLNLALDGFILRATKVPDGSDFSKSLGWEVDLKAAYNITKNLTYGVAAGYFSPGKFYDPEKWGVDGVDKKGVPALMHSLTLTF
jgi:hypothetical protein